MYDLGKSGTDELDLVFGGVFLITKRARIGHQVGSIQVLYCLAVFIHPVYYPSI
jgi:hypothetical protein